VFIWDCYAIEELKGGVLKGLDGFLEHVFFLGGGDCRLSWM